MSLLPTALLLFVSGEQALILASCALLSIGVLFYVFHLRPDEIQDVPVDTRLSYLKERREAAYENLRDLNFDLKAGKLPQSDYRALRAAMEDEAARLLAEIEKLENSPSQ